MSSARHRGEGGNREAPAPVNAVAPRAAVLALAAGLLLAAASAAAAQTAPPQPAAPPQEVSGPEISMLIRSTVVALHHANTTGNYTVLRDLGSRELQVSNTAARLTDLFREFRERNLSLAPAVLFDPLLDEDPFLTTEGVLRLVGHFPTEPQEIVFDLTFRYELGAWRVSVLSVGTRPAGERPQVVAEQGQPEPVQIPVPRLRPQ